MWLSRISDTLQGREPYCHEDWGLLWIRKVVGSDLGASLDRVAQSRAVKGRGRDTAVYRGDGSLETAASIKLAQVIRRVGRDCGASRGWQEGLCGGQIGGQVAVLVGGRCRPSRDGRCRR